MKVCENKCHYSFEVLYAVDPDPRSDTEDDVLRDDRPESTSIPPSFFQAETIDDTIKAHFNVPNSVS